MDKISIQTSQNVDIDYELAGVGDRIVATIIDILILVGYGIGMWMLILAIGMMDIRGPGIIFYILLTVMFLPITFYHLLFEIFFNGQSIGKRIRKIRVVKVDGTQPGIGSYILRWLLRPIDMMFYGCVAIITIAVSEKSQRLGDMAAGTTVIRLRDRTNIDNTIFRRVEDTYQVQFPQVNRLEEKDISLIKKVLNTESYRTNYRMVDELVGQLKQKMEVNSSMVGLDFLDTVVKDYNKSIRDDEGSYY